MASFSSNLLNYFRSWMDKLMRDQESVLLTEEYEVGIKEFMEFLLQNLQVMKHGNDPCPCRDCMNGRRGTFRGVYGICIIMDLC